MLLQQAASPGAAQPHERVRSPALELTADAWGAGRTWLLAHGAAQGNLAACLALRVARGRQAVVQRDVDATAVSGLIAAGLAPHWLAPELDPIAGVAHGVTPAVLDAALTEAPGARAAIVVAPAFHGAMPDLAGLAAVAHCHGAALVVDATWGAHLPFHPALPQHAIAAGADLAVSPVQSPLGGPAGAALLHQGPRAERWLPAAAIEQSVALCAPEPAGAAALEALESARAHAIARGERLLGATLRGAAKARAQLTGVPGVRVLGPDLVGAPGVAAFDPLRMTVDLHDSGRDARAVAGALRERHGVVPALVTDRLLVAALAMAEPAGAEQFAAALLDTLWTIPPREGHPCALPPVRPGPVLCSPRAAWMAPQERVPAEAAVGRIATETLSPYPPGVPAVLPGERLEADVVATLRAVVAAGGVVTGSADGLGTFGVVAGSQGGASRRPAQARRPRAAASVRWTR